MSSRKTKTRSEWPPVRALVLILAIGAALTLVGGIVFRNLPPDGILRVFATPGEPSPFFGGFRPENRTGIETGQYARLIDEPIYFSLAVPPFFRGATVRMEYRNLGQPVIELGARSSHEDWAFQLKPIEADTSRLSGLELRDSFLDELAATPAPKETSDGWKVSETTFDFGPLAVDGHGDLQMIVSLPGMKTFDAPVLVRSVQVEYHRPALTLDHVIETLRRRIAL